MSLHSKIEPAAINIERDITKCPYLSICFGKKCKIENVKMQTMQTMQKKMQTFGQQILITGNPIKDVIKDCHDF